MAKEDVQELPEEVPRKRKQIETALDLHIAMWLAGDSLTPSERRRLEEEKARRKQLTPKITLGIIVDRAGITPDQVDKIKELFPKNVENVMASRSLPLGLKGVKFWIGGTHDLYLDQLKAIVRNADEIIACPQNAKQGSSECWQAIRYAKHRNLVTRVILPNGTLQEASDG